jgi:hypothetical protein
MPGALRASSWAVAALVLIPSVGRAQQPESARADSLRQVVGRVSARLDSLERGQCPGKEAVAAPTPRAGQTGGDSLAVAVEQLSARLDRLIDSRCPPAGAAPAAQPADTSDDLADLRAAAAAAAGQPDTAAGPAPAAPQAEASGPRGANLLNPEISAAGDVRIRVRDESPQTDNFEAREFEVAFQSDLDPYSKTKVFLTFEQDHVGVEEGYIYYTGLPGKIRADLGLFRQPLGDLNRWHLHALPETEYPLVYRRFLGEEGLSGIGVSLYTALPFSIAGGTHEIWVQGTTSESPALYEGGRQPTLLGRIQNFWQLSRSTYGQLGFTATGGDNSDIDLESRLIGLDFRLTYRPPEAGTRQDITFRAEGYRLHSTEVGVTTDRYGAFLDLVARTSRRWIFGARYDWVESPRGPEDTEWRITPTITWWQSEFVYLRLEGEHANSDLGGTQNLLTFQAVWAFGPHKHETY